MRFDVRRAYVVDCDAEAHVGANFGALWERFFVVFDRIDARRATGVLRDVHPKDA
jgi:hypothetical protein